MRTKKAFGPIAREFKRWSPVRSFYMYPTSDAFKFELENWNLLTALVGQETNKAFGQNRESYEPIIKKVAPIYYESAFGETPHEN
jgi:hypothetical protein